MFLILRPAKILYISQVNNGAWADNIAVQALAKYYAYCGYILKTITPNCGKNVVTIRLMDETYLNNLQILHPTDLILKHITLP